MKDRSLTVIYFNEVNMQSHWVVYYLITRMNKTKIVIDKLLGWKCSLFDQMTT